MKSAWYTVIAVLSVAGLSLKWTLKVAAKTPAQLRHMSQRGGASEAANGQPVADFFLQANLNWRKHPINDKQPSVVMVIEPFQRCHKPITRWQQSSPKMVCLSIAPPVKLTARTSAKMAKVNHTHTKKYAYMCVCVCVFVRVPPQVEAWWQVHVTHDKPKAPPQCW